jgi:hypothetical protein
MNKFTDTIKQALAKKQGHAHIESDDKHQDIKKAKKSPPVITGRPVKKATGRGR